MDEVLSILRPQMDYLSRSYSNRLGPAQSSADLLQETCLRAWQNIDKFQTGKNDDETFSMFRSWMSRIVRNLGMNAHRDQAAKRRIPSSKLRSLSPTNGRPSTQGGVPGLKATTPTPSENACADELVHRITVALDDLPDQTAASILRRRFFEGLSFAEISARLGLPESKARDIYYSAMRQLRRKVGDWK